LFDAKLGLEETTTFKIKGTEFSTGDMIADRYRVERELGRGGMGVA